MYHWRIPSILPGFAFVHLQATYFSFRGVYPKNRQVPELLASGPAEPDGKISACQLGTGFSAGIPNELPASSSGNDRAHGQKTQSLPLV